MMKSTQHKKEVDTGTRFAFGKNWSHFLKILDEDRIQQAEQSLRDMLKIEDLQGKTFLDIGSGSGLFSLVARRLGATVHSFDYDPESVACTQQLKSYYFPGDSRWVVEKGSVLDEDYLTSLGQWDVVYSWGVLHHTGDMVQAFHNVEKRVADGGVLFIAIYNDQGRSSRNCLTVKKAYNRLPEALRWIILWPALIRLWGPTTLRDFAVGKPFQTWRHTNRNARGMSAWRDVVDWVGGLPFEVASPEFVFNFFQQKDLLLQSLKTQAGGHGCNEYVFVRKKK